MRLIAVSFLSWLVGIGAYLAALSAIWGQRISRGDLQAVLFWSALASTLAIGVAYAPAMFVLRSGLEERRHAYWWPYPVVAIGLGVLPVLLIFTVWTSNLGRALVSPEAVLFYFMFGAFGAVFGTGFFLAYGRR